MGSAQKRHLADFVPSIFSKISQMRDLFTMLVVEIQFSDCKRVYNVEPKKIMTSDQCQTVTVMGSLGLN